jgi:hypothetical protein
MLVVSVLIAAHVALIGLTFRSHLSVAMIGGVIGFLAVKYSWLRFRRHR